MSSSFKNMLVSFIEDTWGMDLKFRFFFGLVPIEPKSVGFLTG
jgi:hypothetical protein